MARGIRFTKAEREVLVRICDKGQYDWSIFGTKAVKAIESIREKLELAEMPVKKSGLSVNDAIAAFKGVLGQRLVVPSYQAVGVLAQMKNRIAALGLTSVDCVIVASVAAGKWQGLIRAESLVRQADVLLADTGLVPSAPPPRVNSPVELGEEDI